MKKLIEEKIDELFELMDKSDNYLSNEDTTHVKLWSLLYKIQLNKTLKEIL